MTERRKDGRTEGRKDRTVVPPGVGGGGRVKYDPRFRRTKIVATVGPASSSESVLEEMVAVGVDVLRINSSHGTPESRAETMDRIQKVRDASGRSVAILLDLQGPRIRVGELSEARELVEATEVVFAPEAGASGDEIPTTYEGLADDVTTGARILLDDGLLEVQATAVKGRRVIGRVDDIHDLRRDTAHHGLEPLAQGHLRCRTSLAPAAHGDDKGSVADVDDRDLPTVGSDGTVDFAVQELLNDRTNLGVSPRSRACVARSLEDGRYSREQLRPERRSDRRFQSRPRSTRILPDHHHVVGDEHMGNTRKREQPLNEW